MVLSGERGLVGGDGAGKMAATEGMAVCGIAAGAEMAAAGTGPGCAGGGGGGGTGPGCAGGGGRRRRHGLRLHGGGRRQRHWLRLRGGGRRQRHGLRLRRFVLKREPGQAMYLQNRAGGGRGSIVRDVSHQREQLRHMLGRGSLLDLHGMLRRCKADLSPGGRG
eukprot:jgi/Tetstr1/455607/TSEL_042419.t1